MFSRLQKPITATGRRFMATTVHNPLVPNIYRTTFKENFLSDPSTYPLIVVMTVATGFIFGMSANALANYKGLRIRPSAKHEVIPTWDAGHRITVTETLTRNPKAFHADGFKAIRREGLGVDHEAWLKAKQSQA